MSLQRPDGRLLLPGEQIGKWTLAMELDDLIRLNGPPTLIRDRYEISPVNEGGDWAHDFTEFRWLPLNLSAHTLTGRRVQFLGVFDFQPPGYHPAKGIKYLSSEKQVLGAYGKPTTVTTPYPGQTRFVYDGLGIALLFRIKGLLGIYVFRPGRAFALWRSDQRRRPEDDEPAVLAFQDMPSTYSGLHPDAGTRCVAHPH